MTERTAGTRQGGGHPDAETLRNFAHGRLGQSAMAEVERHLGACDDCCRAVQAVPDDRLVGLLRRREAVALLAAAVVTVIVPACSDAPAPATIDGARARVAARKRFRDSDEPSSPKGRGPGR